MAFFTFLLFYLFTFLPFLYQALECPEQFVAHADGVTLDAEIPIHLYRTEIQAQRAIVAAGDRDVLAAEHVGVALRAPGQRLDERVVGIAAAEVLYLGILIAAQHALILLAGLHRAVAAQDGFQIHGQIRGTVPTFKHVGYNASNEAGFA